MHRAPPATSVLSGLMALGKRIPLWLGVVVGICCVMLATIYLAYPTDSSVTVEGAHIAHSISGTSGQLFSGKVTRKYTGSMPLQALKEKDLEAARAAPAAPSAGGCEFWGVVTTIFEPSPAIKEFTTRFPEWCLVVVGDKKTPPYPESKWRRGWCEAMSAPLPFPPCPPCSPSRDVPVA